MNSHRLNAGGKAKHGRRAIAVSTDGRMLPVAWLVLGLLAEAAACSGTSNKKGTDRDAAARADVLLASPDSPPVRDGGAQDTTAQDTTADSPVKEAATDGPGFDVRLTPDTAAPQDARVIADAPGGSLDLPAKDIAEPDAEPPRDTDAASLDSSPTKDSAAADALLPSDGADARLDTARIVPVSDPGIPVYTTRAGTGPCQGKTVDSLIDKIYASDATLPGMGLYRGLLGTDGSYIYAFVRSDGGFAFAFKYGSGDCPSGCIENEYWYFQTDADCVPRQVGHYRQQGSWACGTPLWGVPTNAITPTTKTCP
jgi:hypothetical protein